MIRSRRLWACCAPMALSACVAGPPAKIDTAPPALPDSFAYAPPAATSAELAALLPAVDSAFTKLAVKAQSDAPTLAQAMARIDAARASADRAGADRLPSIGATATVLGTRTNPAQFAANLPPGIAIDTQRLSYGANLTANWDADLFGQLRQRERAALDRLDAASADAAAVRLALTAEIAGSVIDWRTLDQRDAALRSDLVAAESLVTLAEIRERAGIAPGFDQVRAEAAAEASRTRLAALPGLRAQVVGRLVTLTGQSAQVVRAILAQAPARAPLAPAPQSLPSQLLTNRPDVQAAASRLAASDADLFAAAAQRFPKLNLSAAIGLLTYNLSDLFTSNALVGSASGSLLGPLLDFGRIEAEIKTGEANKRAAFAAYRGVVFAALGDAETAYGSVEAADRALAAAQRQSDQTARAANLADVRYRAGLSNFLTVLDARRTADASGEQAAIARGQAARARVLLWQALGGDQAITRPISQ